MKKGLLRKVSACLLAVAMVGTLVSSRGIVRAESDNGQPEENENITLNKTAEWDDTTQTAKITIESYTTGSVTVSNVPSDIVLVLDTSGSMADAIGDSYWGYSRLNSNTTLNDISNRNQYYYQVNGKYYQVYKENEGNRRYSLYYTDDNNSRVYIANSERGNTTIGSLGVVLYEYGYVQDSRMDALQIAVNQFIDQINEKNKTILNSSDKNRLSIIRFSDSASRIGDNQNWANDGYLNIVDDNNVNSYKQAVNSLNPNGGTHPEDGLSLANDVFNRAGNTTERNKVVVMFTDGGPGGSNWDPFDDSVAIDTIEESKKLKDNGITVYSVGVFDGANDSGEVTGYTSEMNRYMHGVSSNYPNATGHYYGNDNFGNWGQWNGGHLNEGSNQGYYLAANNTDELKEIFNKINEDIDAGSSLDATSYVSDVISEVFELPNDTASITAYTEDVLAEKTGGGYTFNESTYSPISPDNITYDPENREIKVKGFNYKENYIAEREGQLRGKHLVIEITLKPVDGFIGGNQILTNDSCSVKDAEGKTHRTTDVNPINIPLMFDFDAKDAAIYVGSSWDDVQRFLGVVRNADGTETEMYYKNERNIVGETTDYDFDGIRNKYVDVTYTVTDKDNKVLGIYKVPAGATIGDWEDGIENFDSTKLDADTQYYVSATVTPNPTGDILPMTVPSEPNNPDTQKISTLHIVKPTITLKDDDIFLGETSDLNQRVDQNVQWTHDEHSLEGINIEGTSNLTYTFKQISGSEDQDKSDITYTPSKIETATFSVTVENKGVDITGRSNYNSTSHPNDNKFDVRVRGGTINFNKTLLTEDGNIPVSTEDGDPIFIFKITRNVNGTDYNYYRYVRMKLEGDEYVPAEDIPALTDLPAGTYTITEEASLRYQYESGTWQYEGSTDSYDIAANGIAEIVIGSDHPEATVNYTNIVKSDDYDSDNGILVNKFITSTDEKGNTTTGVVQDVLDGTN